MTDHGPHGLMIEKLTPHLRTLSTFGLTAAVIGGTFALDCLTPRGLPIWIFYILPIVLTLWTPQPWTTPTVAAMCTGLTLLGYFLADELPGVPAWLSQVSRAISLGIFSSLAYLIHRQKHMAHELTRAATVATAC